MSLTPCPDCKKDISTYADSCPHCSLPMKSKIFCPECKRAASEHAKTCPYCGFPLRANSKAFDLFINGFCMVLIGALVWGAVSLGIFVLFGDNFGTAFGIILCSPVAVVLGAFWGLKAARFIREKKRLYELRKLQLG